MKEVILIDGKMVAYRSHYSHLKLKNKDGKPTGLLHGFLWELLRINKRVPGAAMVICWDGDGKTWRHREFKGYKANRPFNPEWKKMKPQIEALLPMLIKLGLRVYRIDGVEADDIIGILSCQLNCEPIRIYSGDTDMYQLVRDGVCIWPYFDVSVMRMKEVEKWLQAPFHALAEIKAMAGDPSDNFKGLPGIGFAKARKMWKEGFRIEDLSCRERYAKFKLEWPRVLREYRLAKIVCSADDEVWTEDQRHRLHTMVCDVDRHPGRNQKVGLMYKKEFYEFLGYYELDELFRERHRILSLP